MDLLYENVVFANNDKSKQFRIVKQNKGNSYNYISKRVIRFNTIMGNNSAGCEIIYGEFMEALKTEKVWLYE